jgi:hypothetical protein
LICPPDIDSFFIVEPVRRRCRPFPYREKIPRLSAAIVIKRFPAEHLFFSASLTFFPIFGKFNEGGCMPNIFTFTDYRKFLASYYEEKKAETSAFSYQNFARKAGFTSKSAVLNVIKGRKNLSKASSLQMAEAMGLSKREAAYFDALVSFN